MNKGFSDENRLMSSPRKEKDFESTIKGGNDYGNGSEQHLWWLFK